MSQSLYATRVSWLWSARSADDEWLSRKGFVDIPGNSHTCPQFSHSRLGSSTLCLSRVAEKFVSC